MIKGIGTVLCMTDQSDEVKPEEPNTQPKRSKDNKKKNKSSAAPDLKYNKFDPPPGNNQYFYESRVPTANTNSNHDPKTNSTQALYQHPTPTHVHPKNATLSQAEARATSLWGGTTIESDVREIKRILKIYINRMNEKDAHNRIVKEWRLVAKVLDRLFFIAYVSVIILSLATIFPKG